MLVSMKEMLADARKNHYALPAFDVSNYDMMKAVLEACEEEKSPALLMATALFLASLWVHSQSLPYNHSPLILQLYFYIFHANRYTPSTYRQGIVCLVLSSYGQSQAQ